MTLRFQQDYLAVAVAELKQAIRWRDIAHEQQSGEDSPRRRAMISAARSIMRDRALRSRRAFNGELLEAR
jgi:hypothetical protein